MKNIRKTSLGNHRAAASRCCLFASLSLGLSVAAVHAEDGYVESLGSQVVNLRAFKTPNTRIWLDFQTTFDRADMTSSRYIFGTSGDKTGSWASFYVDVNGSFYFKIGDQATFVKAGTYNRERHTMDIAFNENGSGKHRLVFTTGSVTNLNTTSSVSSAVTTQGCPMMLFGLGLGDKSAETADRLIPVKIYGAKIWEGSTLTHDYVPRKIEGKFYLKDLVDGQCVTGVEWLNGKSVSERLSGGGDIVEELGDGYIESHAHEQIDLGIKGDTTTRVEIDHQLVSPASYQEQYLFGSRANNTALTFWTWVSAKGTKQGYACQASGEVWDPDNYFTLSPCELRRTLVLDAANARVAYETAGYECYTHVMNHLPGEYAETPGTLGVFRTRNMDGWGGASQMRCYGLKIYKAGKLVKSYTPYVKNALPGLMDQDGVFLKSSDVPSYTNQQFAIGGNIAGDSGMDDVYLETTGREIIDTEFVPTADTKIVIDFAQLDPGGDNVTYLVGSKDDNNTGPFCWAGMDNWCIYLGTATTKWQKFVSAGVLGMGRYVLTMDLATRQATLKLGGATIATATFLEANPLPTASLALMGIARKTTSGVSLESGSKVRLYSCQIYEGATLRRNYYPQIVDGKIGLYDRVNGVFKAPDQTKGIKLRGKTVDGVCPGFVTTPVATAELYRGETVTLTAEAPFAVSYVWRRNGQVIAGETTGSLTIENEGKRETVRYTVNPVYIVNPIVGANDREAEGTTATTDVAFHHTTGPAMLLIIR